MTMQVRLPKLGKTMEEGTVVGCQVNVGDKVLRGDAIFEIETDKASMEMESPGDGYVKAILVEVGVTVPIHTPLMILGDENEEIPQELIDSLKKNNAELGSPENGDLNQANGCGLPTIQELVEAVDSNEGEPEKYQLGQVIPLSRLQKITAQRMLQSKREIPCFYLTVRVDMTELCEYRNQTNEKDGVQISFNDFILKAAAMGLEKFPLMTGQLDGETIKLAENISIGLAVSAPAGTVAPVVKDVDKKDVNEIANDTQSIIERAKNAKLTLEDLEGGSITVSNLGGFGVDSFTPVVMPGQCSILGVGRIIDTVTADDEDKIRKIMSLTLSVDHKVVNGAYAAQFLDFIRKSLEDLSNFQ